MAEDLGVVHGGEVHGSVLAGVAVSVSFTSCVRFAGVRFDFLCIGGDLIGNASIPILIHPHAFHLSHLH